jgi:hypothetical protein
MGRKEEKNGRFAGTVKAVFPDERQRLPIGAIGGLS